MISIQNGKLTIPDIDRFVGFAGDNAAITKQFFLIDHVGENCTYTLCLRFDDDTVRTVPLTAAVDGGDTVLTWEVCREHLHASGVVAAQLKIADSDGNLVHSTKDFFLVAPSVELDEHGAEAEYVTTEQMRNSINQALQAVTETAPYIDSSGYWCVYDIASGAYVRTAYHAGGITPDSAMSDSSENPVGNKFIKQYVDGKASDCNAYSASYTDQRCADKVPAARKIAGLSLSADIGTADLMGALRSNLYRDNITPNSSGIKGEFGIGMSGEVYFCTAANRWVYLAVHSELNEKMDLIPAIAAQDVDSYEDGSLLFVDGELCMKYNDDTVALPFADDVYTKAEINAMIGNIESLLASV